MEFSLFFFTHPHFWQTIYYSQKKKTWSFKVDKCREEQNERRLPAATDALPQPEVTWHDRLPSPNVTFLLDNMAARKEAHMTYVPLKSIPAA